MFSSSEEVHDVSINWNCILLSPSYNFGLGKWAKIERNDSIHVQWAQWVSKTMRQNRMGFSYICSWSCQVGMLTPLFSPTFQPPQFSVENKKSNFNSCLNLCNFLKLFRFRLLLFNDCPLAGNTRCLFEIFLLFNSITSAVTTCNVGVFTKTWAKPERHFYSTEINYKHQISFLLSLKVELMFLLAILNRLKSFR